MRANHQAPRFVGTNAQALATRAIGMLYSRVGLYCDALVELGKSIKIDVGALPYAGGPGVGVVFARSPSSQFSESSSAGGPFAGGPCAGRGGPSFFIMWATHSLQPFLLYHSESPGEFSPQCCIITICKPCPCSRSFYRFRAILFLVLIITKKFAGIQNLQRPTQCPPITIIRLKTNVFDC